MPTGINKNGNVPLYAGVALQNTQLVTIGGIAASRNQYVFVVPSTSIEGVKSVKINDIVLISDTATTSSDGSNKFTFQLANLTQSKNLLATAKTTHGAEITGDTPYSMTPTQYNSNLAFGDVIELQVTKTGSPTDLANAVVALSIQWEWEVI